MSILRLCREEVGIRKLDGSAPRQIVSPSTYGMKRRISISRFACAVALLLLGTAFVVRAATVDEYTGGTATGGTDFWGESFVTPAGNPFANIAFTFLTNHPTDTPFASGTGFLLSTEYLGTPAGLSSSTTGFIGQATASGGFYTFSASIQLAPSTTYYFYENASIPSGTIWGGGAGSPGRQFYFSSAAGTNFSGGGGPLNFRVTGNPVPEPGTTALLLSVGLAGLFLVRRAKR